MDIKEKKWTIEEGIEEADNREKGISDSKYEYDYKYKKIGDIRECHECKKPVDVISHSSFDLDVMSITFCEEHYDDPVKPPFKKCTDDCPVHGGEHGFDEEKHYNESKILHDMILKIRNAIKEIKPRDDSIMEYDRTREIIEHGVYAHGKPKYGNFEMWMFREFVDYMGLKGKLTLASTTTSN